MTRPFCPVPDIPPQELRPLSTGGLSLGRWATHSRCYRPGEVTATFHSQLQHYCLALKENIQQESVSILKDF